MQKTFQADGPIGVDVQLGSGEIRVERGTDGTVEVELTASDPDSQQLIDAATVELRGDELTVDVPGRSGFSLGSLFGSRGIQCRIRCAEGSSLKTRTKSADLTVSMTLDRADVSTASGDIDLRDVTGDLSVKSASGDVTAGDVGGRASVNTASGDASLGLVVGRLSINSASGDISIDAVAGDAKANTASGDISLEAIVDGEVTLNSASGDVSVAVRRGSKAFLDCSTVSGDVRSELDMTGEEPDGNGPLVHLKARTVSGDITITRAPAPVGNAQEVQA